MQAQTEDKSLEESSAAATLDFDLAAAKRAQGEWAQVPVRQRLKAVRRFRRLLANQGNRFCDLLSSQRRTRTETLSAEVIPLAEAARFLELRAARLLAARRAPRAGRPGWLKGVEIEVRREPLGVVLVIGPANYPLFLPGVQTLQGLVAGNAVLWKPGRGGRSAAVLFAQLCTEAGIPQALLQVLNESEESARRAMEAGVDKIVLTGSLATGRSVLRQAAEWVTPTTMELSGCDAFFILPGADVRRATAALIFGLTLNGGATCIGPRRVFVHARAASEFGEHLRCAVQKLGPVAIAPHIANQVAELLDDAESKGASTLLSSDRIAPESMRPLLVLMATPAMTVMQSDVFAPVAAVMTVHSLQDAVDAANGCRYALGASIFGEEKMARNVAEHLRAGVVTINDVIVPTADPRLSFGGRGASGFGKSRGEEGLMEMTVSKSIVTQRARKPRHLETAHPHADEILESYLRLAHGAPLGRARAAVDLCKAAGKKQAKTNNYGD